MEIIWSIVALGGLGAAFGIMLAVASKKLAVKKDERVAAVRENLPGANCGGCGFPGCDGFADALVAGKAPVNGCAVMGAPAMKKVAEILGVDAGDTRPKAARIMCLGKEGCVDKFQYEGAKDCRAAYALVGGFRTCEFACIGLGTCAKVCKFDAITMDENGIAAIDPMKCTGCGTCVEACPKKSIAVMDLDIDLYAACRNSHKGKEVMQVCSVGCLSCGICAKSCPFGAITMIDNLPHIDYDKCHECRICMDKCPRHTIVRTKPIRRAKINPEKCIGCQLCKKNCPFGAIEGELKQTHFIHDDCRGCGVCLEKCKKGAIEFEEVEQ